MPKKLDEELRDKAKTGGILKVDRQGDALLTEAQNIIESTKISEESHHESFCGEPFSSEMPDDEILFDLADLFKVFADTTRIRILYLLMDHGSCVADIAEVLGTTQSAVSHQLRILKQARLVKFERSGKNVNYSLADDHVYTILAQGINHVCE